MTSEMTERLAITLPNSSGQDREDLVDALPYIDPVGFYSVAEVCLTSVLFQTHGDDVLTVIQDECKRLKQSDKYLKHLPPLVLDKYETDIMKNEMERKAAGRRMEMLSMKRYELPAPPAGKLTDVTSWQESVANSQSQLEHQSNRISNLTLMQEYGSEAWKEYNTILSRMFERVQKQLTEVKSAIQAVNWERKESQTATGTKLQLLEDQWTSLIYKNFEIEQACLLLEREISGLENKMKQQQQPAEESSSQNSHTEGE